MIENEIMDFINTIIKKEGGREIKREDLLSLSGIDSFGYIVLYTQIQERYGIDIMANEDIDYKIYTLENLIKDIQEHSKIAIATKSHEIEKITQKDLQKICKVLIHELDDKTFVREC